VLFVLALAAAVAVVLFSLLPRVGIEAPRLPPAREQAVPPERPPETAPPRVTQPPLPQPPPVEPPAERPMEPAAEPPAGQIAEPPPRTPPVERPAETRERGIFLVQVEDDGAELRLTRVSRTLEVSNTPLIDTLNALLMGPNAGESARGMVSLIPANTRILSARVEGHTAYINFNEYFQFNPQGSEGFASQIQQIVWTATEFPNVRDVQMLIEGNRVDFLHGGIRIGSPIGR